MKLDNFTKQVTHKSENNYFLINMRSGAVDIIDEALHKKLFLFEKKGSITPEECRDLLPEKELNLLQSKGYIISLSENDLKKSANNIFKNYLNSKKVKNKSLSIVFDNIISYKWCNILNEKIQEESFIGLKDFEKILDTIKKQKLFDSVNLWLDEKNNINKLEDCINLLLINNIPLNSIFITIQTENTINGLKKLIKEVKSENLEVKIKVNNEDIIRSILYNKTTGKIIKKDEPLHCKDDYIFCPYIYETFFINKHGESHYCLPKLFKKEPIFSDYFNKQENLDWSDELFKTACSNDNLIIDCPYSIYCSKSCDVLMNCVNDNNSPNICKISKKIEESIIKKIDLLKKAK